jgi:hypothetical protein
MQLTRLAALLAIAVFVAPGCGSEDASSGPPARLSLAMAGPTKDDPKVSLRGVRSVEAGLVSMTLESSDSLHDAQLYRVDGEHSADEVVQFIESADGTEWPRWLRPAGGVGVARPGQTRSATVALEPGTYFVADTQEATDPLSTVAGAARGGIAKLEVTGDGDAEVEPTRARITAREYEFGTAGLVAGTERVTFENDGREPHQLAAFRVRPGATFAQGRRALGAFDYPSFEDRRAAETSLDSGLVVRSFQTVPAVEPGEHQVADLRFERGKYLFMCYAVDRRGSAPHIGKGMIGDVEVR